MWGESAFRARTAALVAAMILTPLLVAPTASAAPYVHTGAVDCLAGGIIHADTPSVMRPSYRTDFRNPEQVYWSPDLYRWNGRRWRLYAEGPQFFAFTSSYGFYQGQFEQAWHQRSVPGSQVFFQPFTGLGPGYYRVRHYFWWSWTSRSWSRRWKGRCHFV